MQTLKGVIPMMLVKLNLSSEYMTFHIAFHSDLKFPVFETFNSKEKVKIAWTYFSILIFA